MPTTYYYSVGHEIIGEHTLGQSRLDYLTDALGGVVATVNQSLTVESTARYKPYRADLATTGTMPMFGWGGTLGYKRTGRPHSDVYVGRRYHATVEGLWATRAPSLPREKAYTYAKDCPSLLVDPTGTQACLPIFPLSVQPAGNITSKGCVPPNWCSKFSGQAICGLYQLSGRPGGDTAQGTVVCCDGNSTPCAFLPPGYSKLANACTIAHEQNHIDNSLSGGCSGCGFGTAALFDETSSGSSLGECYAYEKTTQCMSDGCSGDPSCLSTNHKYLCNACNMEKSKCKELGLSTLGIPSDDTKKLCKQQCNVTLS